MYHLPQRNQRSVDRASDIFSRFAKVKSKLGRIAGEATLAMAVTSICFLAVFLIDRIREGFEYPLPNLTLGEALSGLAATMLLNGSLSIPGTRWDQLGFRRIFKALLPWLSFLLETPYARRFRPNEPFRVPERPRGQESMGHGRSIFRKSFLWRSLEDSSWALILQIMGTSISYIFLACCLARQPAHSVEGRFSFVLQFYALMVGAYACYRCESLEMRGKLTSRRRRLPVWPLTFLPWLGVLAILALAARTIPEFFRTGLATALFFDRRRTTKERWTAQPNQLPRWRQSELDVKGQMLKVQSYLRSRQALLMLQLISLGVLWPASFRSAMAEAGINFAATTLILVGFLLKNLMPTTQKSAASPARIGSAWLAISLGSSLLGFLIGSACGRGYPAEAGAHLFLFAIWGGFGTVVIVTAGGAWKSFRPSDFVWIPALLTILLYSWLSLNLRALVPPLESALIWASIAAWLADGSFALFYSNLFCEPFTLNSLWNRDLPAPTRTLLRRTALILFLPLGGLASAFLAVSAQRRDERLRLWWQARSPQQILEIGVSR